MKNFKIILLVGILLVSFKSVSCWAATLYVHPTESVYTTIGAAINAAVTGDEILVGPGTYPEIDVNKLVYIRSEEGPEVTKIISSTEYAVRFRNGANSSSISGFFIKGVDYGVYIDALNSAGNCESMVIKNNIIEGCGRHGICLYDGSARNIYYINIVNNTISGNGNSGIYLAGYNSSNNSYDSYVRYCEISNNIIAHNGDYGIQTNSTSFVRDNNYYNNDIFNNTLGSTYYVTITEEDGNIFVDPKFIDVDTGNYMLQSMSPCIDSGRQGSAFLDPDGTSNNMGVYGGPEAASFWPYPEGGPVVTNLSVTPASVPQGGTITIKATGSVR